jgi:hypothetical protein
MKYYNSGGQIIIYNVRGFFQILSPVEQYLIQKKKRLFKVICNTNYFYAFLKQ